MTQKVITGLLGILLGFSTLTVHATLFTASDFDLIVEGLDTNPAYPYGDEVPIDYAVWITNNSSQTVVFGDNLFDGYLASVSAQLNGVSVFDSDALTFSFFPVDNNYGDGDIAPGETYYMGGILLVFDSYLLPNVSIVELTALSLLFRNTSPLSDAGFLVDYEGDPLVSTITITTPVPAVSLALLPLFVLLKFFGRKTKPH